MERFWNIIHYCVYLFNCKVLKMIAIPLLPLYKLPFAKRNFEKRGIKDPVKELYDAYENTEVGGASILAGGLMYILVVGFCFTVTDVFSKYMYKFDLNLYGYVVIGLVSLIFNEVLLFHKDKYLKYFKEFSHKPHKWKVKWAFVSFFTILVLLASPLVTLIVLKPYW